MPCSFIVHKRPDIVNSQQIDDIGCSMLVHEYSGGNCHFFFIERSYVWIPFQEPTDYHLPVLCCMVYTRGVNGENRNSIFASIIVYPITNR